MPETVYCPNHPDTKTNLRCSRCDKPVCPQCMIHSPVGIRCKDCGQGVRLPVYDVSVAYMGRAIAASVLIGAASGLVYAILRATLFGLLSIASLAGIGYLIAEGISLATNHKRGRNLQYVAAGGMVVTLVVTSFLSGFIDLFDLVGAGIGVYVAFNRLH